MKAHVKIQLKCSGDRGGCSRCLASSAECTYDPEGDGYGNGSTIGRSKGPIKRRRRQIVPRSSSTTDNDRSSTMNQHDRTSVDINGPSRRRRDGENGVGTRPDGNDWNREGRRTSPSAPPDSTKSASARLGSSSDAPASTDWSSDFFDFNDFTNLNGESPTFSLGSINSLVDGTPINAIFNMAPGPLPAHSQPPNTAASARSTSSTTVSVPESPSALTAHDSVLSSRRPSLGLTCPGSGCQCLTTLAGILERLGRFRLGDKPKTASNLDCLLFCLGSGVSACNKVLGCKICNACQEHSILLATIAKQLAHVCNDLCGCILVHQHKIRLAAKTEAPSTSSSSSSFPGDPSSGYPQPETEGETLVDGEISFGRYQIQGVEMRLRLIQNLMSLHMKDLLALLDQLLQRIGQVDGATGVLTEARKTAYTAHWMLQRLQSQL
ncbi:hypothetical protein N8I77_010946 [Diaporthe amygdali]|uniref:Zn(2)-C6 fungal-type domain-containing protein n=1 Tax=Phomopsis amygdali TaxID=1214568 RepID=A0AAD9SAZ6_PHOAM|nr:hypothetical protein N8I77_010946 [Diaporthe amygdali]